MHIDAHEPLDTLAVSKHAIPLQPVPKASRAQEGVLEVDRIEPLHERQTIVGDYGLAVVIHARSGQRQELALGADREGGMLRFDPLNTLRPGSRLRAREKSFSTVSSPILASEGLAVSCGIDARSGLAKDARRPVDELPTSLGHLVRVDLMFSRDLVDDLFPSQGLKGHLGLELWGVIASCLTHRISAPCCVPVRAYIHLI